MKKIIKLTESDLTRLVKRVIQEQSQIKSVTDTMSKPAPKQSAGTISSTMTKTDPKEWFSNFPCMKNLSIVNGKVTVKMMDGRPEVLLPETGTYQEKGYKDARDEAVNGYVGKTEKGDFYYCMAAEYAKGMGPVIQQKIK